MTSRLCVKGLPRHITDDRLREHFAAKGEVTDAKVICTKDGASRQFGFVGFRSAEEAHQALKHFNRTYIDTCRVTVELAEAKGSSQLTRPWSKYSEGSSAHNKFVERMQPPEETPAEGARAGKKRKRQQQVAHEGEDDPQLVEFLQLMQPRRAGAIWSNEDTVLTAAAKEQQQQLPPPPAREQQPQKDTLLSADQGGKSGEQTGAVHSKDSKSSRKTALAKEPDAESGDEVSHDDGEDSALEGQTEEAPAVVDDGVSDLEYLKSRVKASFEEDDSDVDNEADREAVSDDSDNDSRSSSSTEHGDDHMHADVDMRSHLEPDEDGNEDTQMQERQASHAQAGPTDAQDGPVDDDDAGETRIQNTGRLFLRNLPFSTTEAELSDAFSGYGDLHEVHLVLDRLTRKSRGIAYVQFASPADATTAHAAMDGSIFQGRLLHVLPARAQPQAQEPSEKDTKASKLSSFKEQRESERKSQAGNRAAWNTLFMRSDTVAEAVAAHYGITKSQLLDREAADLPVRMALGETHVVAMTKKALGEAGISVDALEAAAAASGKASATHSMTRSSTVLLVKNLPYSADETELAGLFGQCGPLSRLVLPSTRTLGLVEYVESQDARRAFKALAYKRYQHVPLYLEWAPKDIFRPDAPKQSISAPGAKQQTTTGGAVVPQAEPDLDEVEGSTIYVKNLAWATGDAGLKNHFDGVVSAGTLRSCKVAMRKGPDGKPLSMGFGFVECSSEEAAKAVIKKLQGSMLDGHKLALQLSKRKPTTAAATTTSKAKDSKDAHSTKLIVRNVAFEATRKDVLSLFSPFGHVKSCRLPRKFDGTPRGFAFVDFVTKQEAKNAMDSVGGAHLYGRRLVVEWAQQGDDDLDDIRAKTAAKFRGESVAEFDELPQSSKRSKLK